MIQAGKLSAGHARALLRLESPDKQIRLANKFAEKGYSVRQAEDWVSVLLAPASTQALPAEKQLDPNVRAAVLELERALGTRVKIVGSPASGRIEIRYYSAEDLNRIYEWIVRR